MSNAINFRFTAKYKNELYKNLVTVNFSFVFEVNLVCNYVLLIKGENFKFLKANYLELFDSVMVHFTVFTSFKLFSSFSSHLENLSRR